MSNGSSINKIWIALAIALIVLAVAIFGAYAHYLPKISDDHTAWSSFGSLLSGVFTLAGVLATGFGSEQADGPGAEPVLDDTGWIPGVCYDIAAEMPGDCGTGAGGVVVVGVPHDGPGPGPAE